MRIYKHTMSLRIYSHLVLGLFAVNFIKYVNATPMTSQCLEVRDAYVDMGYSALDVPVNSVVVQDDLEICPAGYSCCTRDMEIQLVDHSRQVYDQRIQNVTESPKRKLVAATTELHSFLSRQIVKAERETDEMFTTAYAVQYTQNKHLFAELFASFRKYYNGEDIDVKQSIDKFFREVFLKMFMLQNPSYNFTQSYISCVGNKMNDIKPFGDIPARLQRNLKMALVSSRTFIQGLAVGRNVAVATEKIHPTVSCTKAHMKMNFCPHCRGLPFLKPCANYCLNVMKGCLAYHSELNDLWKSYIDAMDQLAVRLSGDGASNLESALNPVKDQISSSIMHYHENSQAILHKVFDSTTGCGQPSSIAHREKRSSGSLSTGGLLPVRKSTVGLRTLIESVKVTLREVRAIWGPSLAGSICTTLSATSGEKCWNGESEALYTKNIVGDGIQANAQNPEVAVDGDTPDATILAQIDQLRTITVKLHEASSGTEDVAWVNLEVPLPNVTINVGEERAVRSDYGYLLSVSDSQSNLGLHLSNMYSGSGMPDSDDEDLVKYSGYGKWPGYNYREQEGSGSGLSIIDMYKGVNTGGTGDPDTVVIAQSSPQPLPNIRPTVTQTPKLPANVELVKTTTAATTPASSSNCTHYSLITILLSLLISYNRLIIAAL